MLKQSKTKKQNRIDAVIAVVLFASAFQAPSVHSAQNNLDFAKSLSLYSSGESENAYPVLEKVFSDPSSSDRKKLGAAMILAYAPQSQLKKGRRQSYALYFLERSKNTTDKVRLNLVRIVADGYFNDREFSNAEKYYNQLAQDSDVRNQAYGEYRLGWIELNLQKPDEAFQRWALFFVKSGDRLKTEDYDLFKSILLDSGRAWAEGFEVNSNKMNYLSILPAFSKYSAQGQEFEEGIAHALRRYGQPEILENFRKELKQTPYYGNVISILLKKKTVFDVFPCELPKWMADSSLNSTLLQDEILPYTNQCAKKVVEKDLCKQADGISLIPFFEKFELKEKRLLPRISLHVKCKNWVPACRDLLSLVTQAAQDKGTRTDADTIQAMSAACMNSLDPAVDKSPGFETAQDSVRVSLVKLFEIYSEKHLLQNSNQDMIYGLSGFVLVKDQSTKNLIWEKLEKRSDIYQSTLFPDLFTESLNSSEQSQLGMKILQLYRKTPLSSAQIAILQRLLQDALKAKDFVQAEALLKQYLPMTSSIAMNDTLSGIWEYFWLELNDQDREARRAEVEAWLKLIQMDKISSQRRVRAFGIGVQYGLVPYLWTEWKQYSRDLQAHPDVLKTFYQKTSELIEKNSISLELLQTTQPGKILVRLAQNDPTLTASEVKKVLGSASPEKDDLVALDRLRILSKKVHQGHIKLNGYLPQVLKSKLKSLQNEEKALVATSWSDARYTNEAKAIFEKDARWVISQIQGVQELAKKNQDLQELVTQFSEIISGIEDQISRNAPARKEEKKI